MSIAEQLRVEGMKEGIKKGELKKTREMAKELLLLNMDQDQIIRVTNLSKEEIEEIKKKK